MMRNGLVLMGVALRSEFMIGLVIVIAVGIDRDTRRTAWGLVSNKLGGKKNEDCSSDGLSRRFCRFQQRMGR